MNTSDLIKYGIDHAYTVAILYVIISALRTFIEGVFKNT